MVRYARCASFSLLTLDKSIQGLEGRSPRDHFRQELHAWVCTERFALFSHMCVHTLAHTRAHEHTHTHTHKHTQVHTHTSTHTHRYTHTHTHTHTHTRTHTSTHKQEHTQLTHTSTHTAHTHTQHAHSQAVAVLQPLPLLPHFHPATGPQNDHGAPQGPSSQPAPSVQHTHG